MGMRIIGRAAASAYLERLVAEREVYDGDKRELDNGLVKLDSVKGWDGTSEHKCDGSTVEIYYEAYRKPTKRQLEEAEACAEAGVDLQTMVGRLIDLKYTKDDDALVLVTNGLRAPTDGGIPFRSMNVAKGRVLAIAIDDKLGVSIESVKAMEPGAAEAPKPTEQKPAPEAVSPEAAGIPVAPVNPAPGDLKLKPASPSSASAELEQGVPELPSGGLVSAEMRELIRELVREELRALLGGALEAKPKK